MIAFNNSLKLHQILPFLLFLVVSQVLAIPPPTTRPEVQQENNLPDLSLLPDAVLRLIWSTHGYSDARQLPLLSKDLRRAVSRVAPDVQYRYHAMFPLPSIILCLQRQDAACLDYWTPKLSSTLSDTEAFAGLIYYHRHIAGAFSGLAENVQSYSNLAAALYEMVRSANALGSSIHFEYLTHIQSSGMQLLHRYLNQPLGSLVEAMVPGMREMIRDALAQTRLIIVEEVDAWRHVPETTATTKSSATRALEIQTQLLDRLDTMFGHVLTPVVDVYTILRTMNEFFQIGEEVWTNRGLAYSAFVRHAILNMARLPHLDQVSVELRGRPHQYPSDTSPVTSPVLSRIMDQHLFPIQGFELANATIIHRRLDILRAMIHVEGFPFIAQTAAVTTMPSGAMVQLNFLAEFMGILVAVPTASLPHVHKSWTSDVDALRVVLENGGLRLRYAGFLVDAVRLKDVQVVRYLVLELRYTSELERAIQVAKEWGLDDILAVLREAAQSPPNHI